MANKHILSNTFWTDWRKIRRAGGLQMPPKTLIAETGLLHQAFFKEDAFHPVTADEDNAARDIREDGVGRFQWRKINQACFTKDFPWMSTRNSCLVRLRGLQSLSK